MSDNKNYFESKFLDMGFISTIMETTMAEELYNDFKHLGSTTKIVHLSHSDLDGYGCTILSELASFICPDNLDNQSDFGGTPVVPKINRMYSFINHSKLESEAVYKRISDIFTEASCDQDHYHLVVLITDIGGITIDELTKRFRYANHGDVHFYVIDHHRHEYPESFIMKKGGKHGEDTYIYTYNGVCFGVYHDGFFEISVMQTDSNTSATLGLYKLLKLHFPQIQTYAVQHFAELVSKYDTGHWGNWRIDKIRYMDDNNRIMAIKENVNEEILLQMYYKYCSQLCSIKKNYADLLRFQSHIVAALWTNNKDIAMPIIAKNAVYDFIIEMNLNYICWIESLKRVHRNSSDDPFEVMNGVAFNMPHTEAWDQVMDIDVWPITKENAADNKLPFSMYAKEYLENDTNAAKLLIKVDTVKYHSCDMRSADDKYNCYEIAKINGGGGHPRAAGFPMPEVKE